MEVTVKKEVIVDYKKSGNTIHQVITDAETGEVLDQKWITDNKGKPGKKENRGAYFVKLYKTNLIQIVSQKAKEKKLDLNEAGLLFMLLALTGWQTPYIVHPETKKNMSCSEIADFLHLDRKNVGNLLDRLVNKGMVSKVVNGNGRANNYMINTNVAFWGKTINDTNHLDVFKNCPYIPDVTIKYRKTPKKNK
jgi:DNA-binding MarR family transcriptional regulator